MLIVLCNINTKTATPLWSFIIKKESNLEYSMTSTKNEVCDFYIYPSEAQYFIVLVSKLFIQSLLKSKIFAQKYCQFTIYHSQFPSVKTLCLPGFVVGGAIFF